MCHYNHYIVFFLSSFYSIFWSEILSLYLREASIQEKACSGTGNLGKLFTFISYILAWTVSKRHWLLKESIGTMALENEAYTTIWTILIVAIFLFIVGPILACKLYKKIITTLHPSYQIVEEEIKTEKAQRTKEKCCSKSSCCPKSSCWPKSSCCPTQLSWCPTISSCTKPSCVCCGQKESTPTSHEEGVEETEPNRSDGGKEIKDTAKPYALP